MVVEVDRSPAELFEERRIRSDAAIRLEVPDRVPLEISYQYFPAKSCGIPHKAALIDFIIEYGVYA